MTTEMLALVLVSIQIASVLVSAYNWNKRAWLRKAPIPASLACGAIYVALNQSLQSPAWLVVLIFLCIGIGFYFAVWVQCRNKGEGFI
jgi:hypothetical protein